MQKDVDMYFVDGCGRCSLFQTERCKVKKWERELALLRTIVQSFGFTESAKWGMPCYDWEGKNVVLINAFHEYCGLSFFQGVLLTDPKQILVLPGENSRVVRYFRCSSVDDIEHNREALESIITESILCVKEGRVVPKDDSIQLCTELEDALQVDEALNKAFRALTPGRQRGYNIYVVGAKQSKTRVARIEKYREKILSGKGFHD